MHLADNAGLDVTSVDAQLAVVRTVLAFYELLFGQDPADILN